MPLLDLDLGKCGLYECLLFVCLFVFFNSLVGYPSDVLNNHFNNVVYMQTTNRNEHNTQAHEFLVFSWSSVKIKEELRRS